MVLGEPLDITPGTIRALLHTVQLPIKGAWPPQNCVNWTKLAILKLRAHGYAAAIDDVDMAMARALAYADLRMADPANAPLRIDHLGNEM